MGDSKDKDSEQQAGDAAAAVPAMDAPLTKTEVEAWLAARRLPIDSSVIDKLPPAPDSAKRATRMLRRYLNRAAMPKVLKRR